MLSKNPNLSLVGHTNTITGLSLNPEGTHLLSNGMDSNLYCKNFVYYLFFKILSSF